jgi:hypothetical protein
MPTTGKYGLVELMQRYGDLKLPALRSLIPGRSFRRKVESYALAAIRWKL